MHSAPVKEGTAKLMADCNGLFQVNADQLNAVSNIDKIIISTRHNHTTVKKGARLPGAMFLLAYFKNGTPVMSLPGCVMYTKSTVHPAP